MDFLLNKSLQDKATRRRLQAEMMKLEHEATRQTIGQREHLDAVDIAI